MFIIRNIRCPTDDRGRVSLQMHRSVLRHRFQKNKRPCWGSWCLAVSSTDNSYNIINGKTFRLLCFLRSVSAVHLVREWSLFKFKKIFESYITSVSSNCSAVSRYIRPLVTFNSVCVIYIKDVYTIIIIIIFLSAGRHSFSFRFKCFNTYSAVVRPGWIFVPIFMTVFTCESVDYCRQTTAILYTTDVYISV